MNTKELIKEAASLPVEERAMVLESLLQSFNQPETKIDKKWVHEANKRLSEIKSGHIDTIPGEKVFTEIQNRFNK